jgi:hypothetical protein
MEQLKIYAALFCLEYMIKPSTIDIELRIYQWDGITIVNYENTPTLLEEIVEIMDRIITSEKIAKRVEEED